MAAEAGGGCTGSSGDGSGGGGSGYVGGVTSGITTNGSQTFLGPNGTSLVGNEGNGYARIAIIEN